MSVTIVLALSLLAQQPPPVRQINSVTAISREPMLSVSAAIELAGGRVLVNDILGRRLLLFDTSLATATVVADSDAVSPRPYGMRPGSLLRFRGDSALFATPESGSMQVLGPNGRATRAIAMPNMNDSPALLGNVFGTPGFDARGRLVFFARVKANSHYNPQLDRPMLMELPDSAFVVRYDLGTRVLDTVTSIRIPRERASVFFDEHRRVHQTMVALPPPSVDDWGVTSDGKVAVLRGRDFHVDWFEPDGSVLSGNRLPYSWRRMSDEAKARLIDSVLIARKTQVDSMVANFQQGGSSVPNLTVARAELSDAPDYVPAFSQASVFTDRQGRVWIRTTTSVGGRPVYDIVSSREGLVDRVQLPPNRTIAGFGNGVVYLAVLDDSGVAHLERARIR